MYASGHNYIEQLSAKYDYIWLKNHSAKQSSFEKEQNKEKYANRGGVKWARCQSTPNLRDKTEAEMDELKKPRQTDIGAIMKVKLLRFNISRVED